MNTSDDCYPIQSYKNAFKLVWMEIFDDAPLLTPLTGDMTYTEGVVLKKHNLALGRCTHGWVVGHMTASQEFLPSLSPFETVEEGISALFGIVANMRASYLLGRMDVRA